MDLNIARLIVEAGDEDMTLIEDYSGRGMFGDDTAAISCHGVGPLLAAVAIAVDQLDDESEADGEEIADAVRSIRSDQLGLGMVWY